jgi:hypothetical protein
VIDEKPIRAVYRLVSSDEWCWGNVRTGSAG